MKAKFQAQRKFNWAWSLVNIIIGGSIIYFTKLFYEEGFNEETNRQAIRISARIAVILFSMAFSATALHKISKNPLTWWMWMNRRFLGISFAILHLIHLGFLILLQLYFHPVFELKSTMSLLGGGVAYALLIAMLLTSFPFFSKQLSPRNWKRLHLIGGYWIWAIFMLSYFNKTQIEPKSSFIFIMLIVVIIVRLGTRFIIGKR